MSAQFFAMCCFIAAVLKVKSPSGEDNFDIILPTDILKMEMN